MTAARLLVIQHEDDCPPGGLATAADAAGLAVRLVRAHAGDALPAQLGEAAGLVVLGGGMSADDDAASPWLPAVRSLLRQAVDARLPTLGICLGEQIAALALGGSMTRAEAPELGICTVELTAAGHEDAVLGTLRERPARVFHWHQDTVATLPADAELLATGPDGQVQAFRVGPALWAVQFHPEIDEAIVTRWAETSSLTPADRSPASYGQEVAQDPSARADWARLLEAFCRISASGRER